MRREVAVESTAEAYPELLAARGIDYFFANGGTDFGPIVEAYAKRLAGELPVPKPVTVPHEITAMAMAHGYTMITGRPQVVMVHTIAGTANAVGGLINASRTQIPMLFTAGRTPTTESGLKGSRSSAIHWAQESFDQGSMVREWVKWDYELRPGVDLEGVVDRALALADSEPQGPVYLTLPREVIAEERAGFAYSTDPRMTPPRSVAAPEAIQGAARVLAQARNPLAITRMIGKDPATVPHLVCLAETLNLPIFDGGATHMNFPSIHRLHQPGRAEPHIEQADVILTLESDWPWAPGRHEPHPDATVISIGPDPLFSRYPLRSFQSDISLAGSAALTLQALAEAVRGESLDAARIHERGLAWETAHAKARAALQAPAKAGCAKQTSG